MKNLEEINFTDADFELLQKALGAACLAEPKNSFIDLMLDNMPSGNPFNGPLGGSGFYDSFKREMEQKQKTGQKKRNEEFEERKITLQYKLIQFKKWLSEERYRPQTYTYEQWVNISNQDPNYATGSTESEKKSQEPAYSEES